MDTYISYAAKKCHVVSTTVFAEADSWLCGWCGLNAYVSENLAFVFSRASAGARGGVAVDVEFYLGIDRAV